MLVNEAGCESDREPLNHTELVGAAYAKVLAPEGVIVPPVTASFVSMNRAPAEVAPLTFVQESCNRYAEYPVPMGMALVGNCTDRQVLTALRVPVEGNVTCAFNPALITSAAAVEAITR